MADEQDMKFRFFYDGPALQGHQMDVKVIAPALMAMGQLLEQANKLVNGPKSRVQARVDASFIAGSFGVDIAVVAPDLWQQTKDMLSGNDATAVLNLIAFLGLGAGSVKGLVHLIKWLQGRAIDKVEVVNQDFVVVIVNEQRLKIDRPVLDLYRSYDVRQSLEGVMAPLAEEGIDTFSTGVEGSPSVEVLKYQREWFNSPIPGDVQPESTSGTGLFRLVSLTFKDDNKWRFHDGTAEIYAVMADEHFSTRVAMGQEAFCSGDTLRVRYTKTQWLDGNKIRSEYRIDEVLEHISAYRQIPINFE